MGEYTPRADLQRLDGWQFRLIGLANHWRNKPYAYGLTDCGRFMLSAVVETTGVDLLPGVEWPRGWLGVAKWMIANGWDSVEAVMDDLLPPIPVEETRGGDVVSFEMGGEFHLAVRFGDTALTPGTDGLISVGSGWHRAWRVG